MNHTPLPNKNQYMTPEQLKAERQIYGKDETWDQLFQTQYAKQLANHEAWLKELMKQPLRLK